MIREAQRKDLQQLIDISVDFHNELCVRQEFGPRWEIRTAAQYMQQCFNDENCYFKVYEDDGMIQGVLLGGLHAWRFSPDIMAAERMFYVLPDYRNGEVSKALIKDFEDWAKSKKVVSVIFGAVSTARQKATSRFYQRLGFPHNMSSHYKRVEVQYE